MAAPNADYGAASHAISTSSAPAPAEPLIDARIRDDELQLFLIWVIITRARSNNPALCRGMVGEFFLNPYERGLYGLITAEQHETFARFATKRENLAALDT